ncbi:putative reverse transcriptase domain-containing protein [Tanacetum coccineum]
MDMCILHLSSTLIDIEPVELDTSYEVELADGKVVSTNNVLIGCTLNLLNRSFLFDLMVIELGSYDIIIGMDWLSRYDAAILCGEKKVKIPLEVVVQATARVVGERFYSTKLVTVGSSGLVREEEGWIVPNVHRLPRTEQVDNKELISITED